MCAVLDLDTLVHSVAEDRLTAWERQHLPALQAEQAALPLYQRTLFYLKSWFSSKTACAGGVAEPPALLGGLEGAAPAGALEVCSACSTALSALDLHQWLQVPLLTIAP